LQLVKFVEVEVILEIINVLEHTNTSF